jgi:hypothetical protein
VRTQSAAVLAAIERQRPGDSATLALAYQHFNCGREAAEVLLDQAEVTQTAGPNKNNKNNNDNDNNINSIDHNNDYTFPVQRLGLLCQTYCGQYCRIYVLNI